MGILWTLIIGLVVGAVAKLLMPGKDPGGFIVTMLIGVAWICKCGDNGRAFFATGLPACAACAIGAPRSA